MKLLKHLCMISAAVSTMFLGSCLQEENPCPDAVITVDVDSSSFTYTITAEGLEDILYEWHVNGNLVETEELNDLRDNILDFNFEPGTYNICIKAESDICNGTIEFCKEITILDDPCPWVEFKTVEHSRTKYLFEATFEKRNDILYTWYVDGDSIETAPFGENRWHKFDYEFAPGEHTVCITQVSDQCHDNSFCKEITVEEPVCPEPFFITDNQEGNAYLFKADFEGKTMVPYKWYVNGEITDKENFDGHETDHKFLKDFDPGTYNICIVTYTEDCEEKEYCKELIIEEPVVSCLEVSYTAERDGDNLAYNFTANFEGKNDVHYFWEVSNSNGDLLHKEGREPGSEDDHSFYWQFEAGVAYKVCLRQDDCPDNKVCDTFIID